MATLPFDFKNELEALQLWFTGISNVEQQVKFTMNMSLIEIFTLRMEKDGLKLSAPLS